MIQHFNPQNLNWILKVLKVPHARACARPLHSAEIHSQRRGALLRSSSAGVAVVVQMEEDLVVLGGVTSVERLAPVLQMVQPPVQRGDGASDDDLAIPLPRALEHRHATAGRALDPAALWPQRHG
eukprot:scaffold825_cov249-Pinguiococcus_pyrenoidosus.AAC.30